MAEYQREVDEALRRESFAAVSVEGDIALAEGRARDALATYRRLAALPVPGTEGGPLGEYARLAQAFEQLGDADSAIVYYERFATAPFLSFGGLRPEVLGPTFKRLAEVHQQRGEREKAAVWYRRFVDLWSGADQELQPMVREARSRMAIAP